MDVRVTILVLFLVSLSLARECKIYVRKVTEAEAEIIVDKHNELRMQIANGEIEGQPRGVNLKRLKYDEDLAAEAQEIANSCIFAHQQVTDDRWYAVGQNLYIKKSTAPSNESDWDTAIQSWFDEHEDYTFGKCCRKGPRMTGHYTQLVWANTEYVGCGYTYFATDDFFKYRKLYVCNYGPAGNFKRQFPYKVGKSGCEDLC
ncbi:unnamed protein product [Ceutorhynchus assimilis]|uniref:SCP domain-containing protein n=1 Tax=Ceutorhynchus assimilis TaxID=467358 RepID=A0A9N9QMM7_9CUCU|nr:unnamed protein product [Ceutorhynchus assimilis]